MDALGLTSTVISGLQYTKDVASNLLGMINISKNAELYSKISEIYTNLNVAMNEINKLNGLIIIKNKEIETLNKLLEFKNNIEWISRLPYSKNKNGELDGPYCPQCLQVVEKMIMLNPLGNGCYQCTNCQNVFDPEAEKRNRIINKPRRLA